MSDLSDKYIVRWYMDNLYELVDKDSGEVIKQDSLQEINAYIDLVEKGLL